MSTPTGTRERILERAFEIVARDGVPALTLGRLATAAGVSRQAIYLHFGSRAGVLGHMARHRNRARGFIAEVLASRELEPVAGFEHLVRAWLAYVPDIAPVARGLEAAEIAGQEGGDAWTEQMAELRTAFTIALQRVADAGRLAQGWTVERAADWAWSQAHIDGWAHLVEQRGWDPGEHADMVVALLRRDLVAARRRRG